MRRKARVLSIPNRIETDRVGVRTIASQGFPAWELLILLRVRVRMCVRQTPIAAMDFFVDQAVAKKIAPSSTKSVLIEDYVASSIKIVIV